MHAKTNYQYFDNSNSKLKLYKIQNITVIENSKLENEEDFAEDIIKAIEEAYLFCRYFGIYGSFFFLYFFASNFFGKGYFYGPVQISSLFFFNYPSSSFPLYKSVTK